MGVRLKVPLVAQELDMECWYASACMVAYYRRPGPRLGLPAKWAANAGIQIQDFTRLARAEGLRAIEVPTGDLTAQQLEVFLRNFGPIWSAGRWDGAPHIVVLTGVVGQLVYVNDPNPDVGARVESVAWYNQKLDRIPNCMMYMRK